MKRAIVVVFKYIFIFIFGFMFIGMFCDELRILFSDHTTPFKFGYLVVCILVLWLLAKGVRVTHKR